MRKIAYITLLVMLITVIGILMINEEEQDTEVTRYATKVGLILNGAKDDRSWCQSHYEGLEIVAADLNLEIICKENIPESAASKNVIENLIREGCEVIICDSYGYRKWVLETADQYPDVYFFQVSGEDQRRNLINYFGRMYQMRYLSGIVAGLQTQTNEIGYVAAFPIEEVNRGINAFTLGVRRVNPKANVHVRFAYSWLDDAACKDATEALLKLEDIDILTMHVNSLEPLNVAKEASIWSIGYHYNNQELYEGSYLTAPVWNWDKFYLQSIMQCLQGKFNSKHTWQGLESGLISLAPFTSQVKPGIQEAVDEVSAQMKAGAYDVFYGPIYDNEGTLRVGEGESMPDELLLNNFDWYVEGVQIHEENVY